jgi:hypothetical protein
MKLIPFRAAHVDLFTPRWPGSVEGGANPDSLLAGETSGPAWTLIVDGRVIGCGGVMLLWPGVGEGWMLPGTDTHRHKLALHRTVGRQIVELQDHERLRRLQTIVNVNYPESARWLSRLGFENEGLMKRFGVNGDDYWRLARVV